MEVKYYEFSNHLGNVLEVASDRKLGYDNGTYTAAFGTKLNDTPDGNYDVYVANVISYSDYYPYGMLLDGRNGTSSGVEMYRYGFQGQEKDDEIKGQPGNSINYKYRMHDPRVGRFFAVDPLADKYPQWSPYTFSGNQVIHTVELEGLEPEFDANEQENRGTTLTAENKETGEWSEWVSSPVEDDTYEWIETAILDDLGNVISDNPDEYYTNKAVEAMETLLDEVSKFLVPEDDVIFEAGKTYQLKIEAVEIVNVGGASWGWWEASYDGMKAESDAGGAIGLGGEFGMFTRFTVSEVTFHQTVKGSSLADALNKVWKINLFSAGAIVHYAEMEGLTFNSEKVWSGKGKAGGWSGGVSGSASQVKFENVY